MSSTKNPGRFAGLLYVLSSIVGFFAMGYVPRKLIVHGNAAATASNISASETLFRLGIAGELIGMAGFIFVALALYDLLNAETELKRGYADQEIGKWNSYSSCLVFAVELPRAKRKRYCYRMDGHRGEKFCDEILPIGSPLGSVGTSRTVC